MRKVVLQNLQTQCGLGNPILLRTGYDLADDEHVKSWPTISEDYSDWVILVDVERFNFGSDWQLVYNILPGIAIPSYSYSWSLTEHDIDDAYSEFIERLNAVKQENPSWRENLDVLVRNNDAAVDMLHLVLTGTIMVADKEAFETDHLLLAYLGPKGRVTIQGRLFI
ncbi:uncharacterized protein BDV17DRAFT_262596 [Aspergillus undulatus]|uniref:uncharacterized protein n=1 Tax=Aspergillus undulatus TaxID=1810928 RepID=UPI003CCE0BB5